MRASTPPVGPWTTSIIHYMKQGVIPTAIHTPIPVPAHWAKKVKADIERDCQLGVLEPVPANDPVTWCHRMVITPKRNGDPRRTVDMATLNKCSIRQTHHTIPPFKQASMVPKQTKKTTLDAWNGYHSILIGEGFYNGFNLYFSYYRDSEVSHQAT